MYSIKSIPEFTAWLDSLTDEPVRGVIAARIKRLALGLMGDVEPVGNGVSELRIHPPTQEATAIKPWRSA